MIKRVTIENYMAHKLTVLELARGVTVITGPNNAGKSAIVEALRSIAQNPPYRHAIRHGAKNALIRVELDSGEIIEWSRTEKAAVYKILKPDEKAGEDSFTAETYAKFGRTPPRDVQDILRLELVETETGPVDIHVGNQRQPIFLIDQAGSQAASFFAASTEAVYLLKMQQALKSRTDRAKSKRKELSLECSRAEKKLERYAMLDSIDPVLLRAEALYEKIEKDKRAIPQMADLVEALADSSMKHRLKKESATALGSLSQPPETFKTDPLELTAREIEQTAQLLSEKRLRAESLARLAPPPALSETEGIEDLARSIGAAQKIFKAGTKRGLVLEKTLSPPGLLDPAPLEALSREILGTESKSEAASIFAGILSTLYLPPELPDAKALDALLENLSKTESLLERKASTARTLLPIKPPPSPHDPRELELTVFTMEERLKDLLKAEAGKGILDRIEPVPQTKDARPLEQAIEAIEAGRHKARIFDKRCSLLEGLSPCPAPRDLLELESLIQAVSLANEREKRIEALMSSLSSVRPLPSLILVEDLKSLAEKICSLENELTKVEELGHEQDEALFLKRRQIEQVIKETGVCPLCGNAMDMAHFLEGMHAGRA